MIDISFSQFINSLSQSFVPIIDIKYDQDTYAFIDLSIDNDNLKVIDVSSSKAFEKYIKHYLEAHKASVAYGGYNEIRGIYNRSEHFNQQNPETERNIHLGLDVWSDEGTIVLAPLDGIVHSFQNNKSFGDYGPTIILEHTVQGVLFYTLYGHLSLDSIVDLKIGQHFHAGAALATLGSAVINGDYAPHLHFQIIKDLEGNSGDYPGVSNKGDREFFLRNCPDPNLLLKIGYNN